MRRAFRTGWPAARSRVASASRVSRTAVPLQFVPGDAGSLLKCRGVVWGGPASCLAVRRGTAGRGSRAIETVWRCAAGAGWEDGRGAGIGSRGRGRLGGAGAVLENTGQQLDRDEQGDSGPSCDYAADRAVSGGGDVGGEASRRAAGQGRPGQPAGRAASTPVGEQDQRRDDLDAVYRQGERVGVPAGVTVSGGQLAHVTIGDRPGDPGQPGHGSRGNAADPPICPLPGGSWPRRCAILRVRGRAWRSMRLVHRDGMVGRAGAAGMVHVGSFRGAVWR